MHIHISEIPEQGIHKTYSVHIESEDFSSIDKITGELDIIKSGQRIFIKGALKADILLMCSRCLKSYSCKVDTALESCYVPFNETHTEKEHELSKDELNVSFYDNDIINLHDFLTEQILLSVPMKRLCKTDCKGLCPICGQNLTDNPCQCRQEQIDPRLSALAKLLKKT
jgi:uncharacterized protein